MIILCDFRVLLFGEDSKPDVLIKTMRLPASRCCLNLLKFKKF
uniref:Uncharacterized protein n=1 Tax=Setaria italica TaxID=4555 RepID=K4AN45_SETIT